VKLLIRYLAHLEFHSRTIFEIIWVIVNMHYLYSSLSRREFMKQHELLALYN
jgi:hypothetical protein